MPDNNDPPSPSTSKSNDVKNKEHSDTTAAPERAQEDRAALLDRARAFLALTDIKHQNVSSQRRFLIEKGLNQEEVDTLIRELPSRMPTVPPRTYPQPPPSNLPNLLLGLAKLFTWLTGSSAFLLLIYHRFLLPRLTRSSKARRSLKLHQISHLEKFNASLASLKAIQTETFAALPKPRKNPQDTKYRSIHSLDDLGINPKAPIEVPEYTLLRCALQGFHAEQVKVGTEDLFVMLDGRYPWLSTEDGLQYKNSLWETLNNNSSFERLDDGARFIWVYRSPDELDADDYPLLAALSSLKSALPPPRSMTSVFQHTLQTLTDFTGYITTQTYSLSSSSFRLPNLGIAAALNPQEEEIRREIRALKGLVLNRRTFAPTTPRVSSPSAVDS